MSKNEQLNEPASGSATQQLEALKAEEKMRREKLGKIDELTEKLNDESLSDEDKKVISGVIAELREETKTKDDEISEYGDKIAKMMKDVEAGSIDGVLASRKIGFYEIQIDKIKSERKKEWDKRSGLELQSRQEKADTLTEEMKESNPEQAVDVDKTQKIEIDAQMAKAKTQSILSAIDNIESKKQDKEDIG